MHILDAIERAKELISGDDLAYWNVEAISTLIAEVERTGNADQCVNCAGTIPRPTVYLCPDCEADHLRKIEAAEAAKADGVDLPF
jgi:hypothetical protein